MNINLYILLTFLFIWNVLPAQTYHEDDKEGLRRFLRQTATDHNGILIKNFEQLGLTTQDTVNWKTSEEWIQKVKGITWSNTNPKKINEISWNSSFLIGLFDGTLFEDLSSLDCFTNQLTQIDVSKNLKLTHINSGSNQLTQLDISKNIKLTNIQCYENQLTQLDVSKNINLISLDCSNNKLSQLDFSNNTKLKKSICRNNQLIQLDVSNNTELTNFYCDKNLLTQIDFSKNLNLMYLCCDNNLLKQLDISKNINLRYLDCNSNQLIKLDISENTELGALLCGNNQLTQLDISNNTELVGLYCSNIQLTQLDVSNNTKLTQLFCGYNQLTQLDLSKNLQLEWLICDYNQFKFSDLPLQNLRFSISYFPQNKINGGQVNTGSVIDLSSEYSIDGNITSYTWYNSLGEEIILSSAGNGKFTAPAQYTGDSLLCKMTNTRFPKLTLEYKVSIIPIDIQDHLQVKTALSNKYEVSEGETFKVYVKSETPEKIKIGLFSSLNNKNLITQLDQSRSGFVYTCKAPAIKTGNYVIQPYIIEENGDITIIERPENSHLIDKLSIYIKQDNIWGYSLFSNEISKNMQIKTAVSNLHQVEPDEEFKVNIPALSEVKIGLFDTFGFFVEAITIAKNKNTYTCSISSDVDEGDYIIMPYEIVNGKAQIIERAKNSHWIDRLPIYVVNDIWGYSLFKKAEQRKPVIYPNPASDILNIQTDENITNLEIYNLKGELIKKVTGKTAINIQYLNPGMYILRTISDKGINSYPFSKI